MGFIEDFVDEYMQEHHTDTIDNRTFSITDADYDARQLIEGARKSPTNRKPAGCSRS